MPGIAKFCLDAGAKCSDDDDEGTTTRVSGFKVVAHYLRRNDDDDGVCECLVVFVYV